MADPAPPAGFTVDEAPPAANVFDTQNATGLKVPGNIDIHNRPVVRNPDGSISTVRTISISTDQGEVLIPTVVGGKVVSNKEAIDHYRKTGEHLGIFDSPADATAYAQSLHNEQAQEYGGTAPPPGFTVDDPASDQAQPPSAPATNTAPPGAGFTDEQKQAILSYIPKAKDAADLERFSQEVSGGKARIGNAQDVLDNFAKGNSDFHFADPQAPQQEAPSGVQQFIDNLQNDVAGIAQGAVSLPDMLASGTGKIVSAIPNLIGLALDETGHTDAAKWIQDNITHPLANPVQIGDVIEGASPTPDTTAGRVNRFIGQMVGGAVAFPQATTAKIVDKIAGEVPKAVHLVPAAPSIADDASQAGVRVMTSDVRPPRTFVGKAAQTIGERVPITGTGGVRAAQQNERITAAKNLAQEYGVDELATPFVDDIAKDLSETRGAALTKLTAQKNSVINGIDGSVPAPKTMAAIGQQVRKLQGINAEAYAPVIAKLQSFGEQLTSGKTLSQIEGNRKLLGDMFSDPSLASIRGDGEKAISALYGPLRDDMGAFIKANGSPADFNKWQVANNGLAAMAGQLKNTTLRRVLQTSDMTPENVSRLLFSSKPSDVRVLYDGLSEEGRAKAQSAIIQRAVEKAGGLESLSPDRFATQVKSLGSQIGIVFDGKAAARISGLARVLRATQRASQAALAPPTGVQAVPYAMGVGFTQLFGLPGGIAAAGATGLLARAYESAPVRDLLLRLGRTKVGSPGEKALLERAATAFNAAVQKHVPEAANSNTLSAAAAQPQEQEQQ